MLRIVFTQCQTALNYGTFYLNDTLNIKCCRQQTLLYEGHVLLLFFSGKCDLYTGVAYQPNLT